MPAADDHRPPGELLDPTAVRGLVAGLGLRPTKQRGQNFVTDANTVRRIVTLAEVGPVADGVLRPKWFDGSEDEPMLFGASVAETRAFAMKALERRMKVIGLVAAA